MSFGIQRHDPNRVSIGMLRNADFPDKVLPDWVNTVGVHMRDMGIGLERIKEVIIAMELERRKTIQHREVTDFDIQLANLMNGKSPWPE